MKTTKLLTLAVLMGIAGQITAVENQPFYGYGTESYTTGGANVPSQPTPTSAPLLSDILKQDPIAAFSTTTPATNLLGTEGTGGPTFDPQATVVSGGPVVGLIQNLTKSTTALQQPATTLLDQIEADKQAVKENVAFALLKTTNLDFFTKAALQIAVNKQIDATWKEITDAFSNVANQIGDKATAFNNASLTEQAQAATDLQVAIKDALTTEYVQNQTNISENEKATLGQAATAVGQSILNTIQQTYIPATDLEAGTVTAN